MPQLDPAMKSIGGLLTQIRLVPPNQATRNGIIIVGTATADVRAITGGAIRSVVADAVSQIIARCCARRGTRAMAIECGERGNWEEGEEIDGMHCG
jgi:hypothetical protein